MSRQICIIWDTCSLKNVQNKVDKFMTKYRIRVTNYLVISKRKREYKIITKRPGVLARLFKILRVEDIVRRLSRMHRDLIVRVYGLNNIYDGGEVVDKDAHLALGVVRKLGDCCDIVVTDDNKAGEKVLAIINMLSSRTNHSMMVCNGTEIISSTCISRLNCNYEFSGG